MTDKKDKPKPRRWLQFSITALLVMTTIFAILFAWWRDRTQLRRRLEIEATRAAHMAEQAMVERDRAILAEMRARRAAQMARRRAEAALEAASSSPEFLDEEADVNE